MSDFQKQLSKIQSGLVKATKRLPGIIKVEGLRFISDNFRNEGFETKPKSYKKWPKRDGDKRKKKLIGETRGGKLRKSWQGQTTQARVIFSSALPYAEVHNEGLKAGKPPGFTMPKSPMIDDSDALNKRVETKIDKLASDVFN